MNDFFSFLKSKSFIINCFSAIVVIVILTILTLETLKVYTNHGELVQVPNLTGMSIIEAKERSELLNLTFKINDTADYNPDYPKFSIITQNPEFGTNVKQNRTIRVKINAGGYKLVSVPDIIQNTIRNARVKLKSIGLKIEKVNYIDQLGKDMVYYIKYKQSLINPGEKIPKNSAIELICGNGLITQ